MNRHKNALAASALLPVFRSEEGGDKVQLGQGSKRGKLSRKPASKQKFRYIVSVPEAQPLPMSSPAAVDLCPYNAQSGPSSSAANGGSGVVGISGGGVPSPKKRARTEQPRGQPRSAHHTKPINYFYSNVGSDQGSR